MFIAVNHAVPLGLAQSKFFLLLPKPIRYTDSFSCDFKFSFLHRLPGSQDIPDSEKGKEVRMDRQEVDRYQVRTRKSLTMSAFSVLTMV